MPVETVRDVVDPRMYLAFQIVGYAIFALGWVFIAFAFREALKSAIRVTFRSHSRPQSPEVTRAPFPARRAIVLAFPARRTRNRSVVQ